MITKPKQIYMISLKDQKTMMTSVILIVNFNLPFQLSIHHKLVKFYYILYLKKKENKERVVSAVQFFEFTKKIILIYIYNYSIHFFSCNLPV